MNKNIFWITCILVFMFLSLSYADNIIKSKLVFKALWMSPSIYVQVKTNPANIGNKDKYESQIVEVFKNKKILYSSSVGLDKFVAGFPLSDESDTFVTIWTGGSAYHIKIIKYNIDKIELIADFGSKIYPEIVDIDDNGKLDIITSDEGYIVNAINNKIISEPSTATIWVQQEKSVFTKITRAWKNRFCK